MGAHQVSLQCTAVKQSPPSLSFQKLLKYASVGGLLRNITDTAPRANTDSYAIKEALATGEMAPEKSLNELLTNSIRQLLGKTGIIIDGYPRNLQQVIYFENKVRNKTILC